MNPDVKRQWLEALRSGEYIQGRDRLRRVEAGEDRFCCLGVLCEVAVKNGVIPPPSWDEGYYHYGASSGRRSSAFLPPVVQEWAGLPGDSPDVGKGISLVGLNDEGVPFNKIADIIEEQL